MQSSICKCARSSGRQPPPLLRTVPAAASAAVPDTALPHPALGRFLSEGNSYVDCGHPCERHDVRLRDDAGAQHLVLADMGCRNTVFNAQAQSGEAGAEAEAGHTRAGGAGRPGQTRPGSAAARDRECECINQCHSVTGQRLMLPPARAPRRRRRMREPGRCSLPLNASG